MEDVLAVRSVAVTFYVLRSGDGLYLIDAGFVGGLRLLRRELVRKGWDGMPIRGIVLTHGHIDHVMNVARLARETGAWVAAPRGDTDHYEARYEYRGPARVCGAMEAICRGVFGYEKFRVNRWLDDGDELEVWNGLRVVSLRGHTEGHSGYYCAERRLLFCGDLFASPRRGGVLPPGIFNSKPGLIPGSVAKALSLDLKGVNPNHGSMATPGEHLRRLRGLHERLCAAEKKKKHGGKIS